MKRLKTISEVKNYYKNGCVDELIEIYNQPSYSDKRKYLNIIYKKIKAGEEIGKKQLSIAKKLGLKFTEVENQIVIGG